VQTGTAPQRRRPDYRRGGDKRGCYDERDADGADDGERNPREPPARRTANYGDKPEDHQRGERGYRQSGNNHECSARGGRTGIESELDVPDDGFPDDNGVVEKEHHGQGDAKQRHIGEHETSECDDLERSCNRHGDRNRNDQRRPPRATGA